MEPTTESPRPQGPRGFPRAGLENDGEAGAKPSRRKRLLRKLFVRSLQVFVASPGDLVAERRLVQEVVDKLGQMAPIASRFALRALTWESGVPPILGDAAQTLVDRYLGAARDAEILVMLVGGKLGSPLVDERSGAPYPSGTEYELDSAYRAYRRKGRPILLVYRKEGPAVAWASAVERERVAAFWARFEGAGPYQGIDPRRFSSAEVLADQLSRDLSNVIYQIEGHDRRRGRLWLVVAAIITAVLGWAGQRWYQQRHAESAVSRIVDTALQDEVAGAPPEATWKPVPDVLAAIGPRAVRPIFDRLGDPKIYETRSEENRPDQSPTRALVQALTRLGAAGARDTVCEKLFQILGSARAPLRYPKSTHRIAIEEGLSRLSCPGVQAKLCDYLAHLGGDTFIQPTTVLVDLRDAASPPLAPEEATRCFEMRGS